MREKKIINALLYLLRNTDKEDPYYEGRVEYVNMALAGELEFSDISNDEFAALIYEFVEYREWVENLAEQENLMTASEYDMLQKEQDYEAERNYVCSAGQPA